jgi:hypothetical protein
MAGFEDAGLPAQAAETVQPMIHFYLLCGGCADGDLYASCAGDDDGGVAMIACEHPHLPRSANSRLWRNFPLLVEEMKENPAGVLLRALPDSDYLAITLSPVRDRKRFSLFLK